MNIGRTADLYAPNWNFCVTSYARSHFGKKIYGLLYSSGFLNDCLRFFQCFTSTNSNICALIITVFAEKQRIAFFGANSILFFFVTHFSRDNLSVCIFYLGKLAENKCRLSAYVNGVMNLSTSGIIQHRIKIQDNNGPCKDPWGNHMLLLVTLKQYCHNLPIEFCSHGSLLKLIKSLFCSEIWKIFLNNSWWRIYWML